MLLLIKLCGVYSFQKACIMWDRAPCGENSYVLNSLSQKGRSKINCGKLAVEQALVLNKQKLASCQFNIPPQNSEI